MDMVVVRGSREYDFVGGYLAPRIPKSCFSHEITNSLKEQGFSEVGISAKGLVCHILWIQKILQGLVMSHSVNAESSSMLWQTSVFESLYAFLLELICQPEVFMRVFFSGREIGNYLGFIETFMVGASRDDS